MAAIDWQALLPFRQDFSPLHVIWHAFGCTPLLSCRNQEHRKVVTVISCLWIFVTVVWFIWYMSCSFFSSDVRYGNGIQHVVYFTSTILSTVSALATWFGNITKGFDRSIEIQNLLAKSDFLFDDPLRHLEKTKFVSLTLLTVSFIFYFFGYVIPLSYSPALQLKILVCFLCSVVNYFDSVQYCVLLWELRQRLSALNRRISVSFATKKRINIFHLPESKQNHVADDSELRQLRRTRQTIVEAAAIADDYFGPSQLLGIAKSFSGIVLVSHDVLVTKTWSVTRVAAFVTWISSDFLRIAVLCVACSCVTTEYRRTGSILVSTLLDKAPGHRSLEEDDFLAQVFIWNPQISFTAAGFFKIDLSLLLSVMGATATYLVIIAQVVLK